MTQEEFEAWLEENTEEAFGYIDASSSYSLDRWIFLLSKSLKQLATEHHADTVDESNDESELDFSYGEEEEDDDS